MTEDRWAAYWAALEARLTAGGYAPWPGFEAERAYRRSRFELAKFGVAESVVIARRAPETIAPADLEAFSRQAFDWALANRRGLPRGFGGSVVVHPVAVFARVPEAARAWVERYTPKHWAAFEFPALVDLSAGAVYCPTATPVWGAAYYATLRRGAAELLRP